MVNRTLISFTIITVAFSTVCGQRENYSYTPEELNDEVTEILKNLSKRSNKQIRPNFGLEPVTVGVTMFIVSISSVSEVDMDFTIDFFLRQTWNDPRLKFKGPKGIKTISVGLGLTNLLWLPDTYFANEKKSYLHTEVSPHELLRISETGDILRSTRWTVTATCPMYLRYFPFDSQLCSMEIESYGYALADIHYKWNTGVTSVEILPGVSLPQFKVLGHRLKSFLVTQTTGEYSRMALEIQFVRSMGYYIIQFYIPAGIIVVISWLSFWLNSDATAARVAHGVTTVLTMATLMSSVNATLPKVSYVKALDVYLITCFLMVFASLLENAIVGHLHKRDQPQKEVCVDLKSKWAAENQVSTKTHVGVKSNDDADFPGKKLKMPISTIGTFKCCYTAEKVASSAENENKIKELLSGINNRYTICVKCFDVDQYSRVGFPISFICFNILYWVIYLHISDVVVDDLILFGKS